MNKRINKAKITRRFILSVLIVLLIWSVNELRHKGEVDFANITNNNISSVLGDKIYKVIRVDVVGNKLYIDLINKGNNSDKVCKKVASKIYSNIKKDTLKDKEIIINFFSGDENDEREEVHTLYSDGIDRKLTIKCNTKDVNILKFSKEQISMEELGNKKLDENKTIEGREITVYGDEEIEQLNEFKSLDEVVSKLK